MRISLKSKISLKSELKFFDTLRSELVNACKGKKLKCGDKTLGDRIEEYFTLDGRNVSYKISELAKPKEYDKVVNPGGKKDTDLRTQLISSLCSKMNTFQEEIINPMASVVNARKAVFSKDGAKIEDKIVEVESEFIKRFQFKMSSIYQMNSMNSMMRSCNSAMSQILKVWDNRSSAANKKLAKLIESNFKEINVKPEIGQSNAGDIGAGRAVKDDIHKKLIKDVENKYTTKGQYGNVLSLFEDSTFIRRPIDCFIDVPKIDDKFLWYNGQPTFEKGKLIDGIIQDMLYFLRVKAIPDSFYARVEKALGIFGKIKKPLKAWEQNIDLYIKYLNDISNLENKIWSNESEINGYKIHPESYRYQSYYGEANSELSACLEECKIITNTILFLSYLRGIVNNSGFWDGTVSNLEKTASKENKEEIDEAVERAAKVGVNEIGSMLKSIPQEIKDISDKGITKFTTTGDTGDKTAFCTYYRKRDGKNSEIALAYVEDDKKYPLPEKNKKTFLERLKLISKNRVELYKKFNKLGKNPSEETLRKLFFNVERLKNSYDRLRKDAQSKIDGRYVINEVLKMTAEKDEDYNEAIEKLHGNLDVEKAKKLWAGVCGKIIKKVGDNPGDEEKRKNLLKKYAEKLKSQMNDQEKSEFDKLLQALPPPPPDEEPELPAPPSNLNLDVEKAKKLLAEIWEKVSEEVGDNPGDGEKRSNLFNKYVEELKSQMNDQEKSEFDKVLQAPPLLPRKKNGLASQQAKGNGAPPAPAAQPAPKKPTTPPPSLPQQAKGNGAPPAPAAPAAPPAPEAPPAPPLPSDLKFGAPGSLKDGITNVVLKKSAETEKKPASEPSNDNTFFTNFFNAVKVSSNPSGIDINTATDLLDNKLNVVIAEIQGKYSKEEHSEVVMYLRALGKMFIEGYVGGLSCGQYSKNLNNMANFIKKVFEKKDDLNELNQCITETKFDGMDIWNEKEKHIVKLRALANRYVLCGNVEKALKGDDGEVSEEEDDDDEWSD